MKKWKNRYSQLTSQQQKKLWVWQILLITLFISFISLTSHLLFLNKTNEEKSWNKYLNERPTLTLNEKSLAKNAMHVLTGVYVENVNDVNIKNSSYTVTFQVWFRWSGNISTNMLENYEIYKGHIESEEVLADYVVHGERYQLQRVRATVAKTFDTTRFPLGSYQLRFYIEPKKPLSDIVLIADSQSFINENTHISGFNFRRFGVNNFIQEYPNNKSDPRKNSGSSEIRTEVLTQVELNRENIGLYIRCFIALVGTLGWVLIVLFICIYHAVDPLSMIPGALFGTVSNILVGANLVPEALHTGLLEYVNIFGILIIVCASFAIITINRQRNYYNEEEFASFLGKHIFWTIAFFTIVGNILLPVSAYIF